VYAALSVAQERALNRVDRVAPAEGPSEIAPWSADIQPGHQAYDDVVRGAIAGASAKVLTFLFPAAERQIERLLIVQGGGASGPLSPEFKQGSAVGRVAGQQLVDHLKNDGFTKPWTGTVPTGAGYWIPSALPPGGGVLPGVTPYFLGSNSQFRPGPPPAFGSPSFMTDLNEVLTRTQNVTPEELAFARYWDFPPGTATPPGFWNGVAATYVAQESLDERAATRVFALMHAAGFDALIACWEAKYHYWTIRPSQANPAISLAFTLPNFPSYPSGHSCVSASSARVLEHFFPTRAGELSGWVDDAGLSRILAGIHYRFDITVGQTLGRNVADWAIMRSAQ
jgi:hypothetical protein